jgi:4-diphosphocytidyl-2-C-methyl-D-erythritol kinase
MRVLSPAKINLHLRVGPVQANGFHPIVSWMATVGLFDTLDFTLDTAGRADLRCSDPSLATDERNLVVRAARLLQAEPARPGGGDGADASDARAGDVLRGARIELSKVIPMGGGLGGGSSNAAATLEALNDLWKLRVPRQRLTELAASLGSDVPFFLNGPSSICTGRGEVVSRVDPPHPPKWAVLMLPDTSMPTPAVYRQFDQRPASPDWDEAMDWARQSHHAEELLRRLRNDLETPAFTLNPELARLRERAESLVSRPVRMSGSGSSLFTLYDERRFAEEAALLIQRQISLRTIAVPLAPALPEHGIAGPDSLK